MIGNKYIFHFGAGFSKYKAPKTLAIYGLCDNEVTPGETKVASGWDLVTRKTAPVTRGLELPAPPLPRRNPDLWVKGGQVSVSHRWLMT